MTRVVKFSSDYKSSEIYRTTLANAIEELQNIESILHELIVGLALSGKWKGWSDSQPIGTTFNFTEEMLKDTGDSNVDRLFSLRDELISVKEKLKSGG
jgi:hypothetical protein